MWGLEYKSVFQFFVFFIVFPYIAKEFFNFFYHFFSVLHERPAVSALAFCSYSQLTRMRTFLCKHYRALPLEWLL